MNARPIKNRFKPLPFIISIAINLAIGFVASLVTRPQIAGWYVTLQKPRFNPPNGLFAPVWVTIYILTAIAAYMVWKRRNNTTVYHATTAIYFIQLGLNFSWSIVFFGFHQIFLALIVIVLLWVSIMLNIIWFHKFTKLAAWLLLPYLLWVSFAALLNLNIYLLNG